MSARASAASLLIESEFDILRDWQPSRSTGWELDPANYVHLPPALKAVTRWDGEARAHVLDYAKAPACSAMANRFERWVLDEIAENQRDFDTARRIAWKRVLDAQPQYALAAWRRGDLSAARHHVIWSLENEPERIADHFRRTELGPLIDEMSLMLDSDWMFFQKLRRAYQLYENEPEAAFEILDTFHQS